jgi:hypothetical protein
MALASYFWTRLVQQSIIVGRRSLPRGELEADRQLLAVAQLGGWEIFSSGL